MDELLTQGVGCMSRYQIGTSVVDANSSELDRLLASAHSNKTRPLCLCHAGGIEMYVAKIQGKYVIKRMPNTGSEHAPVCDSYEPPPELSGLGQVMGSAIQENTEDGTTLLKFDFSLSKGASRAVPTSSSSESDSVKTDGNKLTLRGTLHYLWEQASFNRWSPSMDGKRNWYVIRKYLMKAAEDKTAKGGNLSDMLYMPENFNLDKQSEITQRRLGRFMKIAAPEKGARRLMLAVGEVKEIGQSRYGHKIVLKHLPDAHFMMNDDIHKRLLKRFNTELSLWDALEASHLMMIATFSIGGTGVASIEEVALMIVSENWIPFENLYEKMLLDALTQKGRRFTKGMRYNLPLSSPLACVVLSDTEPQPTAMYVVPLGEDEAYMNMVDDLVAESKLASWLWHAGEGEMSSFPEATTNF